MPVDTILAILEPADEPVQDVDPVEGLERGERVCKAESHAGVVGPFSRLQSERAATDHPGDMRMRIAL